MSYAPPCGICKEPLCGACLQTIEKVTDTMNDSEIQAAKGCQMVQMICSYCRKFGTQMVSRGLIDDNQNTPGANLAAFKVLKKFNEGAAPLPFEEETVNKAPSDEVQELDDQTEARSETTVIRNPEAEETPGENRPQEDTVTKLQAMVEQLAQQTSESYWFSNVEP